ncbi:peptidoglycan-binding domain-containing protein [Wenxinia marina]|uniref:Putative peptidoglycan binding domain protein n=1 Tax=Wenxinia marina DSM 24838 TaxID=1123501 RepID=A0A0D0Q9L0_9RHOB|nr:peptidoglycan-binding domain-containing protein [Wenxinia marina]KIQ69057.1 Putative peptidoglycan binding domain protein [Wenxinia marina DSM 24838]
MRSLPLSAAGLAVLAACATPAPEPAEDEALVGPAFLSAQIESGPDGRCYGRDITPAVIQTVTAQALETPAVLGPAGEVVQPAVYASVIRQEIVREREEVAFETLCPPAYTAQFVESLQRALFARGFYRGAVTGHMDAQTGRAVQDFQREGGPDSPLLSLAAARALGLVALSAEQLGLASEDGQRP